MTRALAWAVGAILITTGTAALAAERVTDTGPGCGLGTMLWQDYANQKAIFPQVLMVTTNGTGMNTIAISLGTSGCTNSGRLAQSEKVRAYASVNFDALLKEMAQGQGEHLTSLASLIGIPEGQHDEFFALTQAQYREMIGSEPPTPHGMLVALDEAVGAHPMLAASLGAR